MILLIIALPYILLVCSAEANGNANTPTFELTLDPTSREAWSDWCPKQELNTDVYVDLGDYIKAYENYIEQHDRLQALRDAGLHHLTMAHGLSKYAVTWLKQKAQE